MPKLRRFIVIQIIIVLLSFSPLIIALGAGALADSLGCELHEGFANPCRVWGQDLSQTLYTAFVAGWFMFFTLPLGFVIWLVHTGLGIFSLIKSRSKRS